MKLIQSTLSSDKGFTIMELIVAMTLSMVIGLIALTNFTSINEIARYDMERISLNQNLRSALDIIGINVRIAGENLPGFFPAILVENNGTSDTFTIRRSIIDENLVACQAISSGSSSDLVFADDSVNDPNCSYSNQADVLTAWMDARNDQGGTGLGFIFDRQETVGEFFEWDGESDSGTAMGIDKSDGAWDEDYTALDSFAYVIEEWRFSLNGDTLQMVVDDDTANPINVVNGLTSFNVQVELFDGTVVDAFEAGDDWSDIALIHLELTGEETSGDRTVTRSLSGSFFPRNVLSN